MPDLAALREERELFEEAASTPGARWGLCPQHPGSPTAPYDPRRCWAGCFLPQTAADLVADWPRDRWPELIAQRPDMADEIIEVLVDRGEVTQT